MRHRAFEKRQIAKRPRLCRFIKSYKYKHKQASRDLRARRRKEGLGVEGKSRKLVEEVKVEIKFLQICDSTTASNASKQRAPRRTPKPADSISRPQTSLAGRQSHQPNHVSLGRQIGAGDRGGRRGSVVSKWLVLSLICFTHQHLFPLAETFCPSVKCICDDRLLSANCTNVPSISRIPITLNPLLKRLTLNQLALGELSNSLSVYKQLEYLDLRSNHLRQVRYENFNFRTAPSSVLLSTSSASGFLHPKNPSQQQASLIEQARHQELRDNNQLLARHLKLSIDKSLSDDEIRFHLRELHLADNIIEQLGTGTNDGLDEEEDTNEQASQSSSNSEGFPFVSTADGYERVGSSKRLRASDLERRAPFLSLTKLELLDLSSNRLRKLHQHVFLGLVNLQQLDLSRNLISQVDRYAFVGLVELRVLRMGHNHLIKLLPHLSLAFCNAPMNQLQWLELTDSLRDPPPAGQDGSSFASGAGAGGGVSRLPNQMFICCPNLRSLHLNALQLRYIQVNAFDNLQLLESLSLAGNYLEQVPSSSLSYSNSNLSQTLKHLDLSDTLIEFVNAHSLESLQSLQYLSLNHMQRLVSFDLAALHLKLEPQQQYLLTLYQQQMESRLNQVPGGTGQLPQAPSDYFATPLLNETSLGQFRSIINHHAASQQSLGPLINDQLVELHLSHNSKLQSVHSSLAAGHRIRFSKLRELNLAESPEIRELPLSQMLELPTLLRQSAHASSASPLAADNLHDNNMMLRIDLSSVSSKLNCSSCQMGWLMEAGLRQLSAGGVSDEARAAPFAMDEPPPLQPPYLSNSPASSPTSQQMMLLHQNLRPQSKPAHAIVVSQLESLACQSPYSIPLIQFLSIQAASSPPNCPEDETSAQDTPSSLSNLDVRYLKQAAGAGQRLLEIPSLEVPWLPAALSLLGVAAFLMVALKLGTGLIKRTNSVARDGWQQANSYQHSGHFKWGPRSSLTGCSPASSQQSSSAHTCNPNATATDCSTASILSSPTTALAAAAAASNHCGLFGMQRQQQHQHEVSGECAQSYHSSLAERGLAGSSALGGPLIDFKSFGAIRGTRPVVGSFHQRPTARARANLFSRIAARLAPGAASWRLRFAGKSSCQQQQAHQDGPNRTLLPRIINQLSEVGAAHQDASYRHQTASNQRHLLPGQPMTYLIYDQLNYSPVSQQEPPLGLVYSNLHQSLPESTSYLNKPQQQQQQHLVQTNGKRQEEKMLDMISSRQESHSLAAIGADHQQNRLTSSPTTCATAYLDPINVSSNTATGNGATCPQPPQASHHSTASSAVESSSNSGLQQRGAFTDVPIYLSNHHHKHLMEQQTQVCRQPSKLQQQQATLSQPHQPLDPLDDGGQGNRLVRRQVEHIYVTLDRAIKQQNGADEYWNEEAVYEQPQNSGHQLQWATHSNSNQAAVEDCKSYQWSEARGKFGCSQQHLAGPQSVSLPLGHQQMTGAQSCRMSFQAGGVENTERKQQQQQPPAAGQSSDSQKGEFLRSRKWSSDKLANVTGHSDCAAGLVASQAGSGATPSSPTRTTTATSNSELHQQQSFMGLNGLAASGKQLKGTRAPPTGRSERKKAASAKPAAADANVRLNPARHRNDHVINGLDDSDSNKQTLAQEALSQRGGNWNGTMIARQAPSARENRRRLSSTFAADGSASSFQQEQVSGREGEHEELSDSPGHQELPPGCDISARERKLPAHPKQFESAQVINNGSSHDTYSNQFYYCRPQTESLAKSLGSNTARKRRPFQATNDKLSSDTSRTREL